MSGKNSKQFGVWMDLNHATIVGREDVDTGNFVVLAHAKNEGQKGNSNENAANNAEQAAQLKFFKEITASLQNAEEIHVSGTGIAQEQFIHYLAETPQFKNTIAKDSTSNQMSDENFVTFITEKFN